MLILCVVQGAAQASVFMGSAAHAPTSSIEVVEAVPPQDAGLYRVKSESKFCHVNLLGAAGYPNLGHYTSLTDNRYIGAMKKLGYSAYWMEVSGCCGTRISDVLFSNKYSLNELLAWSSTGSGNLGYLVPSHALPETVPLGDRIAFQNQLCRRLSGESVFTRFAPEQGEALSKEGRIQLEPGRLRWKVPVTDRSVLFFDAFDCVSTRLREKINDAFSLRINGQLLAEDYPTQNCNGILELGEFEEEIVIIEINVKKPVNLCSFGIWGLATKSVETFASNLQDVQLHYESESLAGTVYAEESQSLFLSVPYYQGMSIQVNGQAVSPRIVLDCFMEVPLFAGENQILIQYLPAGLAVGFEVSLCTAGALLCLGILQKQKTVSIWTDYFQKLWYRTAPALLNFTAGMVLLTVYFLPVIVWMIGVAA